MKFIWIGTCKYIINVHLYSINFENSQRNNGWQSIVQQQRTTEQSRWWVQASDDEVSATDSEEYGYESFSRLSPQSPHIVQRKYYGKTPKNDIMTKEHQSSITLDYLQDDTNIRDTTVAINGLDEGDNNIKGLQYPLYIHQQLALQWMSAKEVGPNKGGILADDMGLGKTISTLALISSRRANNKIKVIEYSIYL